MNLQSAFSSLAVAACASAGAQPPPTVLSDASLERAYWACIALDSKNTAAGLRMDDAAMAGCSAISKELQTRRFGGDFGRLHEWTKARRTAMARKP